MSRSILTLALLTALTAGCADGALSDAPPSAPMALAESSGFASHCSEYLRFDGPDTLEANHLGIYEAEIDHGCSFDSVHWSASNGAFVTHPHLSRARVYAGDGTFVLTLYAVFEDDQFAFVRKTVTVP